MKLGYTRAMVNAALVGDLDGVEFVTDPVFGVEVPTSVRGVPSEVLRPRDAWCDGAAYDASAAKLAQMFRDNFEQFAHQVADEVRVAGPS
jgi:phosphoenolpyruvate carboxykinase (ATP)